MCDYMCYVTEPSNEAFWDVCWYYLLRWALILIPWQFICWLLIWVAVKGVEELINEFTSHGRGAGYLACMIAVLYFLNIYELEKSGASTIWKPFFRGLLADNPYPVSVHLLLLPASRSPFLPRPYVLLLLLSLRIQRPLTYE